MEHDMLHLDEEESLGTCGRLGDGGLVLFRFLTFRKVRAPVPSGGTIRTSAARSDLSLLL